MLITKKYMAITTTFICILALATVAQAEGSWTSYITGALTGFDSRTWYDGHMDHAHTKIRFAGCRDNNYANDPNDNVTVQLTKEGFFVDKNMGRINFFCWNSATGDYGEMQEAGNYHFTVVEINGCTNCSFNISTSNPGVWVSY